MGVIKGGEEDAMPHMFVGGVIYELTKLAACLCKGRKRHNVVIYGQEDQNVLYDLEWES